MLSPTRCPGVSAGRRRHMVADTKKISRMLKTARGQLDGILKMVEEDRYCVDTNPAITPSCRSK